MPKRRQLSIKDRRFVQALADGQTGYDAYQGAINPDVSYQTARSAAARKLQQPDIQAALGEAFEAAGVNDARIAEVLNRNLDAKASALWQKTGESVELGDDGRVQLQAVELYAKMVGKMAAKRTEVSSVGLSLVIDGSRLLSRTIDPPHSPRDITPENT